MLEDALLALASNDDEILQPVAGRPDPEAQSQAPVPHTGCMKKLWLSGCPLDNVIYIFLVFSRISRYIT